MVGLGTNAEGKSPLLFLRSILVPALLALGLSGAASAQHGGGGGHASGGGHGGGFSGGGGFHGGFSGTASSFRGGSGRSSGPTRGNPSYASHPGYGGVPRFGAGAFGSRGPVGGASLGRPAFYNRAGAGYPLNRGGRNGYGYRGRGERFGYGYGYPGFYSSNLFFNPFFFDPFFGFGEPFYDDGDTFWDTGSVNSPDASLSYGGGAAYGTGAPYDNGTAYGNSAGQQQDSSAAYAPQSYPGTSSPAYGPENEAGPWALPSDGQGRSAPARQEALVTIVYKDGRPAEHIRNYALTRSALLVTDARMREIPLDQIDLATTQRVNRAAGIDFQLPQSY